MKKFGVVELKWREVSKNKCISKAIMSKEFDNVDDARIYYDSLSNHLKLSIIEFDDNPKRLHKKMYFGKYKDKEICEVPINYIYWLFTDTDKKNNPDVKYRIINEARMNAL